MQVVEMAAHFKMSLMVLLLLIALTGSPSLADEFSAIRAEIARRMTGNGAPSLSVAVARNGSILWQQGFGWADRENRVRSTEHTPYSLASISKPITATGLMRLVEAGRVRLDDPINTYIAPAKLTAKTGDVRLATVRRVASHSAGLPLHYQFFYRDEPHRPPPAVETIRRYGILITPPGERYSYSNIGYGILDYLIERVSGQPYAEFMRREVFLPLGLPRMAVGIPPGSEKLHAVRYGADKLPIPDYDFDHAGASAIYASAHDLIRFAMFHLRTPGRDQKPILSAFSLDEMQKPAVEINPESGYGIGWNISRRRGNTVVSHSGGMGGVSTILLLVPKEKIAVAALSNDRSSLPIEIAYRILNTLMGAEPHGSGSNVKPQLFKPTPAYTGDWKGNLETHSGSHPFLLRIQPSGQVEAKLGEAPWTSVIQPGLEDGYLTGSLAGQVETEDAARRPHRIQLSLKLRGNILNGAATAISIPGARAGNALTSWVEVVKQ